MGNSEVGHLNLGAGFPVLQDLPRINRAIADGTLATNPALVAACRHALDRGGRIHLLGLIGPGGIHAHDDHLVAMVDLAHAQGLPPDGSASTPSPMAGTRRPGRPAVPARLSCRGSHGRATLATVSGRYWAMDRDGRWDRTRRAYRRHRPRVGSDGRLAARRPLHRRTRADIGDEFIEPTVVLRPASRPACGGDAIVHLNFRADRARQLTQALALRRLRPTFDRGPTPSPTCRSRP